jgi:hypothetical protein
MDLMVKYLNKKILVKKKSIFYYYISLSLILIKKYIFINLINHFTNLIRIK